jgi:hypothetical protein
MTQPTGSLQEGCATVKPHTGATQLHLTRPPHVACLACGLQEGCVTVKPRTVGSRDSIYRAAVEAAIAVAVDPIESGVDIGDVPPTR